MEASHQQAERFDIEDKMTRSKAFSQPASKTLKKEKKGSVGGRFFGGERRSRYSGIDPSRGHPINRHYKDHPSW